MVDKLFIHHNKKNVDIPILPILICISIYYNVVHLLF